MATNIKSGYWTVLPYHLVEHLEPLRLSPLGIKEERDRRPRLVVDHSFYGVNDETELVAPVEAMQYGQTLPRLLFKIRHANPKYGPVWLAKYDVTDGFYNIQLQPNDALMLATILPCKPGETPLVAIPLALTMGWTESPPTFCALTETVCDLVNWNINKTNLPPHRLEEVAAREDQSTCDDPWKPLTGEQALLQLTPAAPVARPLPEPDPRPTDYVLKTPLRHTDIFVDDFMQAFQGSRRQRNAARRLLFHVIDKVLLPNNNAPDTREERISIKKLLKAEGAWTTRKTILGWIVDTAKQTIELPEHRQDRLRTLLGTLKHRKRVSINKWQRVLGELRFAAAGIPGSAGLFSALQLGLRIATKSRVRVDKHLQSHLQTFEDLVNDLSQRPTRLGEIIPDEPRVIGATDACGIGLGGVFFTAEAPPIAWRAPLPPQLARQVVTADNPDGRITINDLEQAAVLLQHDLIAQHYDIRETTISTLADNVAAASRFRKGAVTSREAGAYLCCLASTHQRHYRYCPEVSYIPGDYNSMADDCSRLWHLSDLDLLTHLDSRYPQPNAWRLYQPSAAMLSSTLLALQSRPPEPGSWARPNVPASRPGRLGLSSVPTIISPSPSKNLKSPTYLSSCLHNSDAKAPTAAASPYELARYRQPYWPLERRSNGWLTQTPLWPKTKTDSCGKSNNSLQPTASSTLHLRGPGRSPPPCSPSSMAWWTATTALPSGVAKSSVPPWTSPSLPSSSSCDPANTHTPLTTRPSARGTSNWGLAPPPPSALPTRRL